MEASCVGGLIHVPKIFWGQDWFDQNCAKSTENHIDKYVIKTFTPATKRGYTNVAACYVFDAAPTKRIKVTMSHRAKLKHSRSLEWKLVCPSNILCIFFLNCTAKSCNCTSAVLVVSPPPDESKMTTGKRKKKPNGDTAGTYYDGSTCCCISCMLVWVFDTNMSFKLSMLWLPVFKVWICTVPHSYHIIITHRFEQVQTEGQQCRTHPRKEVYRLRFPRRQFSSA